MHCTQCGTLASPDAKFCAKCGSPIGETEKPTEAQAVTVVVSKPRALWLYIVGILLFGAYAAIFIPAIVGLNINPQVGPGSMFWNGLFFYLWWKRRGRKGWHGALVGSVIGLFAFFAAAFISALIRHGAGG
ncbi:MAG: zinc ribbon domain-containing protein [Deltaproteobacteria bacterium]|nr:zinc ribbon domain-containing protein [Deltaproteobacteria bacterium]